MKEEYWERGCMNTRNQKLHKNMQKKVNYSYKKNHTGNIMINRTTLTSKQKCEEKNFMDISSEKLVKSPKRRFEHG